MKPEPVNPFVPGPGSPGGREAMKHRGWADCDRAWRTWLASDEAVERAARALCPVRWNVDDEQLVAAYLSQARAVLAALRGDET